MTHTFPTFIPGLQLNAGFYRDIIRPLLTHHYPQLTYSAALLGYGSDVQGFDNTTSMDHNWGPRLQIFLSQQDHIQLAGNLHHTLTHHLPFTYQGFPVHFADVESKVMALREQYPLTPLITIDTWPHYVQQTLNLPSTHSLNLTEIDWLYLSDQKLRELTGGQIFHDGLQTLHPFRTQIAFYPHPIWIMRLASLWHAIAEEEAFIGRTIERQDWLGLKLISTRLVNTLMKICFYLERQYIPYSKWQGTAFQQLNLAPTTFPVLKAVLQANEPTQIEQKLVHAYQHIVNLHNQMPALPPLTNVPQYFHDRPYTIIGADTIITTLLDSIAPFPQTSPLTLRQLGLDIKLDALEVTYPKMI